MLCIWLNNKWNFVLKIDEKLKAAQKDVASRATANKIRLMKMKGKSVGDNKIPVADRVFFTVHPPSGNSRPLFVSKSWTVSNNLYMFLKLHLKHLHVIYWKCLMSCVWIHVYGMTKNLVYFLFHCFKGGLFHLPNSISSYIPSYCSTSTVNLCCGIFGHGYEFSLLFHLAILHLLFYLYHCSSWLMAYSLK